MNKNYYRYTELPPECAWDRAQEAFEYPIIMLEWDRHHLDFIHGDPWNGSRIRFANWLELQDRGYVA